MNRPMFSHAFLICSSAIILFLVACNDPSHDSDNGLQELAAFDADQLGFNSVKKYVFRKNCLSCHTSDKKVSLDSYKDALNNKAAIYHTVFETSDPKKIMPPNHKLHPKAAFILKTWLQMGAPYDETPVFIPNDPNEDNPDDMNVLWAQVKEKVFDKSCNRCHKADNDWQAVNFNDVNEVRSIFKTIFQFILFSDSMPPRADPPVPLPSDWLDKESESEEPNPNALTQEQKVLLYRWYLNDLKE